MLGRLHSAPLLFLLWSLPGNYSPGCAFSFYRDSSSASPSSSWRIWQLLLLPLLFLLLPRLEAAGSGSGVPSRSLHLCSDSTSSLSQGTPSSHTQWPHTWTWPPLPGAPAGSPGSAYPSPVRGSGCLVFPGAWLLLGSCSFGRGTSPHHTLPPHRRVPRGFLSDRVAHSTQLPHVPRLGSPTLFLPLLRKPSPSMGEAPAGLTVHPDWRR